MFFRGLISGASFHPWASRNERGNQKKSMLIVDHLIMSGLAEFERAVAMIR
jgi:hypothetical protein